MKKFKLTTSGKIFFGLIAVVAVLIIVTSIPNLSQQSKPLVNIYCLPDCLQQQVSVGVPTLIKSCFLNQSTCEQASLQTNTQTQPPSTDARILVGFTDSVHNVPRVGMVTMLDFNVTKVFLKESNQTDWITVFDGSKTFDVATLSGQTAIIADTRIPLGNYTEEKIVLGMGSIKVYSLLFNIYNKTYDLKPGTNQTVVSYSFSPTQDTSTVLTFDLNVESSVTHTVDGYWLTPQFNISSLAIPNSQQPSDSIFIS